MAWVISILTIISVELTIRKSWLGWLIASLNQVLWFILIVGMKEWGLLPLNAYMCVQSCRGARRWYKEREIANVEKEADVGSPDG